jgi:DNA polymerase-4
MILHVDMDAFYAAVEVRECPELAGKPVVVGGSAQRRGVVAAASYEARRFGIHSAMSMTAAERLCPHLIRLPVRMALYTDVSRQLQAIFARYTPQIEPLALDEAFLDVAASERLFGDAALIARRIKGDIREELKLVASVGVAPTKFVAKIASDIEKPDGLVVVSAEGVRQFLDPLPISRLWGAGKVTSRAFERLGLRTIGQVRRQSPELMQRHFGKLGDHFWLLAQGIDERRVVTDREAKSISHETTFAHDLADVESLKGWLLHLTEQVAWRLRREGKRARTVQLKIRFSDFRTITRARSLSTPTDSTQELWSTATSILALGLENATQPIRLLGMGVSGFDEGDQVQIDLFSNQLAGRVDSTLDAINDRFGTDTVSRGTTLKRRPDGDTSRGRR